MLVKSAVRACGSSKTPVMRWMVRSTRGGTQPLFEGGFFCLGSLGIFLGRAETRHFYGKLFFLSLQLFFFFCSNDSDEATTHAASSEWGRGGRLLSNCKTRRQEGGGKGPLESDNHQLTIPNHVNQSSVCCALYYITVQRVLFLRAPPPP